MIDFIVSLVSTAVAWLNLTCVLRLFVTLTVNNAIIRNRRLCRLRLWHSNRLCNAQGPPQRQRGSPHVRFAGGGNLNSAVLELTVVIAIQYDTRRYFNVRSKADIVSLMYHTEPN